MSDSRTRQAERDATDDAQAAERVRHERCRSGECCAHAGETVPLGVIQGLLVELAQSAALEREAARALALEGMDRLSWEADGRASALDTAAIALREKVWPYRGGGA